MCMKTSELYFMAISIEIINLADLKAVVLKLNETYKKVEKTRNSHTLNH